MSSSKILVQAEVRANMAALASYASGRPGAFCDRVLYFNSLNAVQRYKLKFSVDPPYPLIESDLTDPSAEAIIASLMRSEEMEDHAEVAPVPPQDLAGIIGHLDAARALLHAYSTEIEETVCDLLATIIVVHKDGYCGGSFWHVLGAIWMSPNHSWEISDYAENLLHETVHQAMFLDDMVNTLFNAPHADLATNGALIRSSIRGVPRPYDYSFHAATVSVALMDLYENLDRPEQALGYCEPLLETLSDLRSKRGLLSQRGCQVLDRMLGLVSASPTFCALQRVPTR